MIALTIAQKTTSCSLTTFEPKGRNGWWITKYPTRSKFSPVSHTVNNTPFLAPKGPKSSANALTGFAVVGEYEDPKIMDAQKAAFEQMLSWLKSH